ncbi:hypothetical protein C5167_024852 [Papaver somniferum]|uniref:OVATE domain-containing protein n=1 Tax=Papaver somniferum TaxID=3469 RepID=A0A4Y7JRD8_PAPSO|nr:transcription repressor OFP17-like [Papaver somniferum]RZC63106.1 hypothetical protein C5167_024852 [Papaver somniferum]
MRLFARPSCGCSLKSKLGKRPSSVSCCSIKSKLITRHSFSCGARSLKTTPTFKKQSSGRKLFKRFRIKKRLSVRRPRFRRNRPRVSNRRNPIRKFLALFRRKNRPPVPATVRKRTNGKKFRLLSVVLCRRRKSSPTHHHQTTSEEESDEVGELRSGTCGTGENDRTLFPSPLTPAYVRHSGVNKRDVMGSGSSSSDVDGACRSFESHLVEMIIEEGKMCDLTDVEELLYCWNNLENPVFIGLVSRFYGELCKDLFSNDDQDEEEEDQEQNTSTIPDFNSSCNQ